MQTQTFVKSFLKTSILGLCFLLFNAESSQAQSGTNVEQQIITLSKDKWQWMADKNVDKLAQLFDDKAKFVHMSGTWKKDEELEIIRTGSIWYKKADVHDVAVELFDDGDHLVSHYAGGHGSGQRSKYRVYSY